MDLNLPTLLLQIGAFLVLIALMKKFLYKPLLGVIDKRALETQKHLKEAQAQQEEACKLFEEAKKNLQVAREEAADIKKQAHQTSLREKEDLLQKGQEEAANLLHQAKMDVDRSYQKTKEDLQGFVAGLALQISEKMLGREIKDEDRKRYADQFAGELEGSHGSK